MKIFGDHYLTVVAENEEQARRCYKEYIEMEPEDNFGLVDGSKRKMWYAVDELPEKYQDEAVYPRKDWCGEYVGVEITLDEAVGFRKETPPYILSVSGDLT